MGNFPVTNKKRGAGQEIWGYVLKGRFETERMPLKTLRNRKLGVGTGRDGTERNGMGWEGVGIAGKFPSRSISSSREMKTVPGDSHPARPIVEGNVCPNLAKYAL